MTDSPFWHFNSTFDAAATVIRHAAGQQAPRADRYLSYFGVAIDPAIYPDMLGAWAGLIEIETIPANWHSDLAEFAAALRAVELARGRFTMIELGCGWGCWMSLTGVVARRRGLDVRLIGVEAEPRFVALARATLGDNGFNDAQVTVHHGIAAGHDGQALFPRQADGAVDWGLAPIFPADRAARDAAIHSGGFEALPLVPLADLAGTSDRIDLLHIDIQGGEADLVEEAIGILRARVAYIVIGTHGRDLEGRLVAILTRHGFRLEIERPAIFAAKDGELALSVDGVQGWRNMALADRDG